MKSKMMGKLYLGYIYLRVNVGYDITPVFEHLIMAVSVSVRLSFLLVAVEVAQALFSVFPQLGVVTVQPDE